MAVAGESSSSLLEQKPVIVRVKRKANQSPLDAFWLEINERAPKRPLLDLAKLSLSDSPGKAEEELKTKKVFVRHMETVSSFETTIDLVKSFVDPTTDEVFESKTKSEERRHSLKKDNAFYSQKQGQILSKARHTQEVVAKNARFEQIWKSRKGKKEESDQLQGMCHFYDILRVDADEKSNELKQQEELSLEDQRILQGYLPLLREFIPSAALEVESDLHAQKQGSKLMMRISTMCLISQNMILRTRMMKTIQILTTLMRNLKMKKRNQIVKHLIMNQKMRVPVRDPWN